MSYDEVEIEDMDWNEEMQAFTYQCPCGDLFSITLVSVLRDNGPEGRMPHGKCRSSRSESSLDLFDLAIADRQTTDGSSFSSSSIISNLHGSLPRPFIPPCCRILPLLSTFASPAPIFGTAKPRIFSSCTCIFWVVFIPRVKFTLPLSKKSSIISPALHIVPPPPPPSHPTPVPSSLLPPLHRSISLSLSLSLLLYPSQEELQSGEEIARCPSCSLFITVIYNVVSPSLCCTVLIRPAPQGDRTPPARQCRAWCCMVYKLLMLLGFILVWKYLKACARFFEFPNAHSHRLNGFSPREPTCYHCCSLPLCPLMQDDLPASKPLSFGSGGSNREEAVQA